MNITFDLETIPDQRAGAKETFIAESLQNFNAPSSLTKERAAKDLGMTDPNEIKFTSKESMIEKWEFRFAIEKSQEVAEENWRKTSLDGSRGQICAFGIALNDLGTVVFYDDSDERSIIVDAFEYLSDNYDYGTNRIPKFIGHNVINFDLRFLFQRCVVHGIKPPPFIPFNPAPWADNVFDTSTKWAGHGNRISMNNLCAALDMEGKSEGLDGSKVWDYVKDGRIDEVAAYCKGDVDRTREIYKRMTFQ